MGEEKEKQYNAARPTPPSRSPEEKAAGCRRSTLIAGAVISAVGAGLIVWAFSIASGATNGHEGYVAFAILLVAIVVLFVGLVTILVGGVSSVVSRYSTKRR